MNSLESQSPITRSQDTPSRGTQSLYASSIGSIIYSVLNTDQVGSVLGKTSKGIFFRTQTRWLGFLSFEPYRNPLSITIIGPDSIAQPILNGMDVNIEGRQISIPNANTIVHTKNAHIWEPGTSSNPKLYLPDRHDRIATVINQVNNVEKRAELRNMLQLVGNQTAHLENIPELELSQGDLISIRKDLKSGTTAHLANSLIKILGSGRGLTPAGDDFIIGILLSVNRWKPAIWEGSDLRHFNQVMVKTAYQKTTSISSNLIECASLGLGDERLINALDCLMSNIPFDPAAINALLGWGESSGIYALAGIVFAGNS